MRKIITFIATTVLAFATSGEICEKNGGNWTWHGDINQWQCNNLPDEQATQRLAQYETNYENEYKNILKDKPQMKVAYIQPSNKKEACKLWMGYEGDKLVKEDSYHIFWDGACKDGFANGIGREIEKADMQDNWGIAIYENKVPTYYATYDVLNNDLFEGIDNPENSSSYGVRTIISEKNNDIEITKSAGELNRKAGTALLIVTSPFWNNSYTYTKQYINFRYMYFNNKDNINEDGEFDFFIENHNGRNGWGLSKRKNQPVNGVEYLNNQLSWVNLPHSYNEKADAILKEIYDVQPQALQAQQNAQLVKKQYLKKICKDNVRVNFMDNTEYKEICEDKAELKLQAKIDRKLEQLEKKNAAIIQKQQQEQAQQKQIEDIQNEQLRQQAYQEQQLNIQRQQQQEQVKRQEQQDSRDAWSSVGQSLNNVANQLNQNAYNTQQSANQMQQLNNQMYQQKQDRKTNMQLQQINNNLNNIRYGY